MDCNNPACRLNDELLELLSDLELEQQQSVLRRWRDLDLAGRDALLCQVRASMLSEPDLMTLAKLAEYFQCGIYDMVRYTRLDSDRPEGE